MKIWEMRIKDRAIQVSPNSRWKLDESLAFDNAQVHPYWNELSVSKHYGSKSKKLTDIVPFSPGSHFALSKRAVDDLYDLIENDVELLPIDLEGRNYWIMFVKAWLDCVDYERSEYRTLSSGKIESFIGLWLNEGILAGHNIFKIKDTWIGSPYVSEAFMERALQLDDSNIRFTLVWDSDSSDIIRLNPLFH